MMTKSKHLLVLSLILLSIVVFILHYTDPRVMYPSNKVQTRELRMEPMIVPLRKNNLLDLNVKYILNNESLCGNSSKEILAIVIITSYFGNTETRMSMRKAFGDGELKQLGIRRLFLLAQAPSDQFTKQNAIVNESNIFKDIVQGDFIEAYRNLTYKHLMGIRWVCQFCSHAKYVIKMDDDIVVDVMRMPSLLNTFTKMSSTNFVSGYVLRDMKPIRDQSNKWFVTPKEYRPNLYPTFLSGWFYISNPQTFKTITEYAKQVTYFWIDDILITGILAQIAKIRRIDISRYFTPHSEFLECCIKDLEKKINCNIMIGPNGGDPDLFYTFNEKLKMCEHITCRERDKPLNETCVAELKLNLGRGKAFISNLKLG